MTIWHFANGSAFGRSSESGAEALIFHTINTDEPLHSSKLTDDGYSIATHGDAIFLDLKSHHRPDDSFVASFVMSDDDASADDPLPRTYMTFGYHVRGRSHTCITVGRPAMSARMVLGTVTELGTYKAFPIPASADLPPHDVDIKAGVKYRVTLVFDSSADMANRLQLYTQRLEDPTFDHPLLVCSSAEMADAAISVVDPKVIFGSTAWTNEPEWESVFDIAPMKLWEDFEFRTGDFTPPIFYDGSPYLPRHISTTIVPTADNASRIEKCMAVVGDDIEFKFWSIYRVLPEDVVVTVDGVEVPIVQELTNPDFEYATGAFATAYTARVRVTDLFPVSASPSYSVHMTNNMEFLIEFPSPLPLEPLGGAGATTFVSDGVFIEREGPTGVVWEVSNVTVDSIEFKVRDVLDDFVQGVTGYTRFLGYEFVFTATLDDPDPAADPAEQVEHSITVPNMLPTDVATITGLLGDRPYHVRCACRDVVGNEIADLEPSAGKFGSPVETITDTDPPSILFKSLSSTASDAYAAGIKVVADTWDATARPGRTFDFVVAVLDYALSASISQTDLAAAVRAAPSLVSHVEQNAAGTDTEHDAFFYYDQAGEAHPIATGKTYYVYLLAEDFAENRVAAVAQSHKVNNAMVLQNAGVDRTHAHDGVAGRGDTLFVEWSTTYITGASDMALSIMGESVVPQSEDGVMWRAELPVATGGDTGLFVFSADLLTLPAGTTGKIFSQNALPAGTPPVYVETRTPTMTAYVDSTPDSIRVTNFGITDVTIVDATKPFVLKVSLYHATEGVQVGSTITENFEDLSQVPFAQFRFDDLVEGQAYNVRGRITTVFQTSPEITLVANRVTEIQPPTVQANVTVGNVDGAPVLNLGYTTVRDDHSPVTAYAFVNTASLNGAALQSMLDGSILTPVATDVAPGQTLQLQDLESLANGIGTYRNGSGELVPLVPRVPLYYFYVVAYDGHLMTFKEIAVDFSARLVTDDAAVALSATVGGDGAAAYLHDGDEVVLSWTSLYISAVDDFVVKLMGVPLTPVSADGMAWTATTTYAAADDHPGHGDFGARVEYMGDVYTAVSPALYIDDNPPAFALVTAARTRETITMRVEDVVDAPRWTGDPDAWPDHAWSATVTLKDSADDTVVVDEIVYTGNLSNVLLHSFVFDALTEFTTYRVSATLTDPAGNTGTAEASSAGSGLVRTKETGLPSITVGETPTAHVDGDLDVRLQNVTAVDELSDFQVYVALFQNAPAEVVPPPEIPADLFTTTTYLTAVKSFQGAAGVPLSVESRLAKYVSYNGTTGTWGSVRSIAYNLVYRVAIYVVDADGNVVRAETSAVVGQGPAPEEVPVVEVVDDTGLGANTDMSVTFAARDDGTLIGLDTSGSGNHLNIDLGESTDAVAALSTNSVVNEFSLDMSTIEVINFPPTVSPGTSFTYSSWMFLDAPAVEEPLEFLRAGAEPVVQIEEEAIVVSAGRVVRFDYSIDTEAWTNLSVSADGTDFRLFANGVEIKSSTVVNDTPLVPLSSGINIPSMPSVLIDAPQLFNIPLSSEEVATTLSSGSKQVHLSFESGVVYEYNADFSANGALRLNGFDVVEQVTTIFYDAKYTVHQSTFGNDGLPIVFTDSANKLLRTSEIEFFLDGKSVGSDPIAYITGFNGAQHRKIEITPSALVGKLYMGSYAEHDQGLPAGHLLINTNRPYIVNYAKLTETTPIDASTMPVYVHDTPVGDLAIRFDQEQSQFIRMDGGVFRNMEAEQSTISAWVNVSPRAEGDVANRPIVFREGTFEMGLDGEDKCYVNLFPDNISALVGTIEKVALTPYDTLEFTNVRLSPPGATRTYFLFATVNSVSTKAELLDIVDKARGTDASKLIYEHSASSSTTLESVSITHAVGPTGAAVAMGSLLDCVAHVVARENVSSYTLGDNNDARSVNVSREVRTIANVPDLAPPGADAQVVLPELNVTSATSISEVYAFALAPDTSATETHRHTVTVIFDGGANRFDFSGLGGDPDITLRVSDVLHLDLDTFVHPLEIVDLNGSRADTPNNGGYEGSITWAPTRAGTYVYRSTTGSYQGHLSGTITVTDRLTPEAATAENVSAFAERQMVGLPSGYATLGVDADSSDLFVYADGFPANALNTLRDIRFARAFDALGNDTVGATSRPLAPFENVMVAVVARLGDGTVSVNTIYRDFARLSESNVTFWTDPNQSNRYYSFNAAGDMVTMASIDDTLETWTSLQFDYLFDISKIGSMWEYELYPLADTSFTESMHFGFMLYDLAGTSVIHNTQYAHGWHSHTTPNTAQFQHPEGYPTWHDGSTGNRINTGVGSKWPRYHRMTVIKAESKHWTGNINSKTLNPKSTFADANEVLFEFFADPERTQLIASGHGAQLRSYEHNDSYFHRSNQLYGSVFFHPIDTPNAGIKFGKIVKVR